MENPYQTGAYGKGDGPVSAGEALGPGILQILAATKSWVRLCAFWGSTGTLLSALVGFVLVFHVSRDPLTPIAMATGIGIFYLGLAVALLLPSIHLWRYGAAIARLIASGSKGDLIPVLERQRGIWRVVGVGAISFVMLMLALVVGLFFVRVM